MDRRVAALPVLLLLLLLLLLNRSVATDAASGAAAPWLAYVSGPPGEAQVYVIRSDGTGRTRLTSGPGEAFAPACSHDGRHLAFVRAVGNATQVFVATADGSALRQWTHPPGSHASPAWSPDGRMLAVVRLEPGGARSVYVVNVAGSAPRRLSAGDAPAWSPDGRYVAYLDPRRGYPELYVVPPARAAAARRVETPTGLIPGVTGFAWSPTGRWIAYTSRSGPTQEEIRVVEVEGSDHRWFSSGSAPSWSADGARIAFTVSRVGSAYISIAAVAGGGGRILTDRRWISVRPTWSSDGRYIAFISLRGADAAVYVMRPDGRGERRLDQVNTDFSRGRIVDWRPR